MPGQGQGVFKGLRKSFQLWSLDSWAGLERGSRVSQGCSVLKLQRDG